jgi:hypothetical protein
VERRLAEIHIERARSKALRLFAFSGSVYPAEWGGPYIELIVPDLFEFAFHARRINQICGLEKFTFPDINKLLVKISEGDPGDWETNYQYALNRLVHAKTFKFGNAHADHRRLFLKSEANLIPLYVRIETDQREIASISIYGLIDCFLSFVIPEIKRLFPEFRF